MKIDKQTVQQLVFRPKTDGVFCGAKVSDKWFSFGVFKDEASFPLKEGQVISFEYEEGTKFGTVNLSTVSVEQPQQPKKTYNKSNNNDEFLKRISFGNAVNVASIMLGDKANPEEVFKKAIELFGPCASLRDKISEKYKGVRQPNDLGAKLGDAFKHAASRHTDIDNMLKFAEEWLELHIKYEDNI